MRVSTATAVCAAMLSMWVPLSHAERYDHSRVLPGSPLMEELLRRPFPTTKAGYREITSLLLQSGNAPLVELLDHAEARVALRRATGEMVALPATVGDALDAERNPGRRVSEDAREVSARVAAAYPPGGAQAAVEPMRDVATHSRLVATLRVTNGLEAPVSEATFMAGPDDPARQAEWTALTCRPEPPIQPHTSKDVRCEGGGATEQLGPALDALKARGRLRTHTILTPIVWVLGDHVSAQYAADATPQAGTNAPVRDERTESNRAASTKLAAVPCSEKGSCAEIAREDHNEWKKEHLGTVVNELSIGALFLSALAATMRRPGDREAWPGAVISFGLIACSLWILATAMAAVTNSYLGLLGLAGVAFGAIPFLIALAGVGATLRQRRTPLRIFAVCFAAMSSALLLGVATLG
jgi:hypothetical protein